MIRLGFAFLSNKAGETDNAQRVPVLLWDASPLKAHSQERQQLYP
jgi:hypothetical protein